MRELHQGIKISQAKKKILYNMKRVLTVMKI